jgi:hypothetical protein
LPAPVEGEPGLRLRKRMDVEQLDAAFQRVLGTAWMEQNQNQLTLLAASLGKPDFVRRTDEDLTMSPLFSKFLADAAQKVCADALPADAARAQTQRLFYVGVEPGQRLDDAGLDAWLTALLLRFHGSRATPASLSVWRDVVRGVAASSGAAVAEQALCVTLVTHPDFTTY